MTHILVATGPIHQDLIVCYSNMVVFSSDKCNLNSLTLLHVAVMIAWVIMWSMKKKRILICIMHWDSKWLLIFVFHRSLRLLVDSLSNELKSLHPRQQEAYAQLPKYSWEQALDLRRVQITDICRSANCRAFSGQLLKLFI